MTKNQLIRSLERTVERLGKGLVRNPSDESIALYLHYLDVLAAAELPSFEDWDHE